MWARGVEGTSFGSCSRETKRTSHILGSTIWRRRRQALSHMVTHSGVVNQLGATMGAGSQCGMVLSNILLVIAA